MLLSLCVQKLMLGDSVKVKSRRVIYGRTDIFCRQKNVNRLCINMLLIGYCISVKSYRKLNVAIKAKKVPTKMLLPVSKYTITCFSNLQFLKNNVLKTFI